MRKLRAQLTISILPRSIMFMFPPRLDVKKTLQTIPDVLRNIENLQELQQKVEVNIIFLFPHRLSDPGNQRLKRDARRSDRLITQRSVKAPSARFGLFHFKLNQIVLKAEVSSHIMTVYSEISDCSVISP